MKAEISKEKERNPIKIIDKLFSMRLKNNKELSDKYQKLYEYINPFLQQNEDILKLANSIKFSINFGLNTDDVVLITSLMASTIAQELTRPRMPFKITCHKCGELVMDMSALEEEFDKKFGYDTLRQNTSKPNSEGGTK